MNKVQNNKEKW